MSFNFIVFTTILFFNWNCSGNQNDDNQSDYNAAQDKNVSQSERDSVNAEYQKGAVASLANTNGDIQSLPSDKSNVLHYFPENHSKAGDVDYTRFLQKAIDENSDVILPDFPIAINYKGISIPSNRKVEFQQNSKLIMLPNDKKRYHLIKLLGVENVEIISPTLVGDRDSHKSNEGEWGMGISILSSHNVRVRKCNISDFWGDGIYIGRDDNGAVPSKIFVEGGVLSNIRRNGISVISGDNINFAGLTIKNIDGVLPMAGIDIEPNNKKDIIGDINIESVSTSNCNIGVQVGIRNLPSSAETRVAISVTDLISTNDNHGVLMGDLFRKNRYPSGTKKLAGIIRFDNVQINKSRKEPIKYFSKNGYDFAPQVVFSKVLIDSKKMSASLTKEIKDRNFSVSN